MNVDNKKILKNIFFINLFILINYIFYILNFSLFFKLNTLIIFFLFSYLIFFNLNKDNIFLGIFFILFSIILLGSATQDHDARSIWLFHAKRIFFDNNIYSQLDNYADFSQNDYNPFVASLSASIVHLIKGWNEVFPKFANLILASCPIFFLQLFLKNKLQKILFVFFILFIFEKRLINGEMDALLSLYYTSIVILFFLLLREKNFFIFGLSILFFASFLLIKSESFFLFLFTFFIYTIFLFFYNKNNKNFFNLLMIILFSFIPFLHWKYLVFKNNISNWYLQGFNLLHIKSKIFDFKEYLNIFSELVLVKSMFIALILFFIVMYNFFLKYNKFFNSKIIIFNNDFDKLFFINSLVCFLYFIFLFFIFLFSNIDLNINEFLEAGSFRYTNPISFSLCYFSTLVLFNREKKLYFK